MRGSFQALVETPEAQVADTGTVIRRLSAYLLPYKVRLGIIVVMVVVSAITNLAGPFLTGLAVDRFILHNDITGLSLLMLLLLAANIVGALSGGLTFYNMGWIGQHILAELRHHIFVKVQQLTLRYFDKHPVGDLMSRLVNDVDTLNQILSNGLIQLISSSLSLLGILIVMLLLNWQLALASFVVIPLMVGTTYLLSRRARVAYRKTRQAIGEVSTGIEEQIQGVRVAQAFNRTQANRERFAQINRQNRDANISAVAITSAFSPSIDILSTVGLAIVAGFGGYLVLMNHATVGTVVAFIGYVQQFFRPVQQISSLYAQFQSGLAGAERIFTLMDEPVDQEDKADAKVMPPIKGEVEFDHVYFTYGREPGDTKATDAVAATPSEDGAEPSPNGKPDEKEQRQWTLEDISFVAQPGQTIALVGSTGAGKTTIVSLLNRFYDVDRGAILIDGIDIRDVTRASLRSQIGLVLQDSFLFVGTVADNIRYGRLEATDEEVEQAAKMVNAHEFIMRLPKGYATELGERGQTLSQGQRQLLSFARALLANPRILILDEATSNVDTRTELLIQSALETLLQGRTSFVIAHRLSTIRNADLVMVIEDGRIVERGTHEQLMEQEGIYYHLYSRQFRTLPTEEPIKV